VTCRTVDAGDLRYRFCPDDPPVEGDRLRAVVIALARDEITGQPPDEAPRVATTRAGLVARVARDGLLGLVGHPARLFPGLDVAGVDLDLSIRVPRYLPRRFSLTLGPVAGFPQSFAPVDLGVVPLHRAGLVLRGRAVRRTGLVPTPLAGVDVSLDGVWSAFPPHDVDPVTVMEPPDLVSLFPGLYADRTAGVDGLERRDMVLAAGQEKRLLAPAAIGARAIRASDRDGLNVGDVVAIDPGVPGRTEYVAVTLIQGATTPDQPATVTLAHPLAVGHADRAVCVRAVPQAPPPGGPVLLTRDGAPGDPVAFVAALAPLAGATVVEVAGGAASEFQTMSLYRTTSDPAGYYRLPILSRVAMVMLHAELLPLATQTPIVSPDYRLVENRYDAVFP
jgi:hypothetical protein